MQFSDYNASSFTLSFIHNESLTFTYWLKFVKSETTTCFPGTLSPVFPFYDIFRFNIKVEEIPLTKVSISLYDYDADEDDDDSLGEVVINLQQDEFIDKIITKWFTVQPKVRILSKAWITDTSCSKMIFIGPLGRTV